MLGDVFNILLKISGDQEDATRALSEVAAELKAFAGLEANARVGVDGAEAARAKLDELQAKIDALHGKDVKVDVDTSRVSARLSSLRGDLENALASGDSHRLSGVVRDVERLGSDVEAVVGPLSVRLSERIAQGFASLPSKIGSFLTNLPSLALNGISKISTDLLGKLPLVGGAFESVGSAGAAAAPLVVLLAVALAGLAGSIVAAIAGLAALATSLAGVLLPALALGIAVVAKLVTIVKDYQQQQQNAAQTHRQVAQAAQTQRAAQENLTAAYENLRQATEAATRAQQDNRQAVIEDQLAVKQAAEGVDQAHLNVRKAEQALRDFRQQVGGSDSTFADLFRKATDVNFRLDPSRLDKLAKGAAPKATPDQSIQLEQLILDIRNAKLSEQQATNNLHDSNVRLSRDRQTEAQFLREGLNAYPGYTAAVRGVRTAQDQLATATRGVASAQDAATKKLQQLSPFERAIGQTLSAIGKTIDKVFTPVIDKALGGLVGGIKAFVGILSDGSIRRALTGLGDAMGAAFQNIGSFLSGPEFRQAFADMANGAAQLVQVLGSRVLPDFFAVLTRIAVAGLPVLLQLFGRFADVMDGLEHSTRNRKDLRDDIDALVKSTVLWVEFLGKLALIFFRVSVALAPIGNAILGAFLDPQQAIDSFLKKLGLTKGQIKGIEQGFSDVAGVVKDLFVASVRHAVDLIGGVVKTVLAVFGDVVTALDDLAHGRWSAAWHAIEHIPEDILKGVLEFFKTLTEPFRTAASVLGNAFAGAFKTALGTVVTVAKTIVQGLVDVVNFVIGLIDKLHVKIPSWVPLIGGHTFGVHVDPIPNILGDKSGPSLGDRMAGAILSPRNPLSPGAVGPALAGAGGRGHGRGNVINIPVHVAGGGPPEPEVFGAKVMQVLRRRGL